jgi:hypothetical protein
MWHFERFFEEAETHLFGNQESLENPHESVKYILQASGT